MTKVIVKATDETLPALAAFLFAHRMNYTVIYSDAPEKEDAVAKVVAVGEALRKSQTGDWVASAASIMAEPKVSHYSKKRHRKAPVNGRTTTVIVAEHINARPGVRFTANDLGPVLRAEGFRPTSAPSAMLNAFRAGLVNGMRESKPFIYWAKEVKPYYGDPTT